MLEPVREQILRVVPLEKGDCLSCKLIGTGVCYGASLAVLLTFRRIQSTYTGFRRKIYAVYAVSLMTGMTLLGTARLFDMSFFEKPKGPDGKRRTTRELVEEDINSLRRVMYRVSQPPVSPPLKTDTEGKTDS